MRPIVLTLLFLLSTCTLEAQSGYTAPTPEEREKAIREMKKNQELHKSAGVKASVAEVQVYDKKNKGPGKFSKTTESHYDREGHIEYSQSYFTNGKPAERMDYSFDSEGRIANYKISFPQTRSIQGYQYSYEGDRMTESRFYTRQDQTKGTLRKFGYDEKGYLTESNSFSIRNGKLKSRYVYTYYEDGSKKRTEKFNRKGKLKLAMDYSCDQSGKPAAPASADQRTICEKYETGANGELFRIVETLMYEKNNWRQISKFDSNNKLVSMTSYTESGKIIFHEEYTWSPQGKNISVSRYSGDEKKLVYRSESGYDEKGMIISLKTYKAENVLSHSSRWTYEYY